MTTRWSQYDEAFQSQPRTPREIKEHERRQAAWEKQAREHLARQVALHSERFRKALADAHDIQYAMDSGGPKTINDRRRSTEQHMSDSGRFRERLSAAEQTATDTAREVSRRC